MTDSKDYYLWRDEKGEQHCRRLFNVTEWIIPGSDGDLQEDIKKALYHGFANHPPVTEVDYEHHAIRLIGLSVSNPHEEKKGVWKQLELPFK